MISALALYKQIDVYPRSDVMRMINMYGRWYANPASKALLSGLTWYLDSDPNHISHCLSEGGKKRKLIDVALKYESIGALAMARIWNRTDDIEQMLSILAAQKILPPIIVVLGKKYPNFPESSFVDGVHRALAAMIYCIRQQSELVNLDVIVGHKPPIISRIMRKFLRA